MGITTKTGKKSKGEQTRELILSYAMEVFAEVGYQEASIQKIADHIKISQSAVLFHFKNKINLFTQIVYRIIDLNSAMMLEAMKPNFDAWQRLNTHFATTYLWVHRPQISGILLGLYYMANYDAKLCLLYDEVREKAQEKIAAILLAGQREGKFSQELNIDYASRSIHALLIGTVINHVLIPGKKKPLQVPKSLSEEWESELAKIVLSDGQHS